MTFSWRKEVKALRICETPKILRAYIGLYPNEPRIDRQNKIILLMRQTKYILAAWKTEATEFPEEQESQ